MYRYQLCVVYRNKENEKVRYFIIASNNEKDILDMKERVSEKNPNIVLEVVELMTIKDLEKIEYHF